MRCSDNSSSRDRFLLPCYQFEVERAIYRTVLHRLFAAGSDRAAEQWREEYEIPGTEKLDLHHLYRAMAWLGQPLQEENEMVLGSPRCIKDLIEEALFDQRRDLFTEIDLVVFDTTSIYFEGQGERRWAAGATAKTPGRISNR